MNWRWYLFWVKDVLTGGHVLKAYKHIKKSYYNGNEYIQKNIKDLLRHATETTEFYKNYDATDINNFPVVNKREIIENFDNIKSKKFAGQKLHTMSTSGSTGTPFTVVQNKEKRYRVIAEVLFFGKLSGYTFGERQMFLRVWVKSIKKSKLKKFLQNMIPQDISNLNEEKMLEIEKILKKDKKIKNILSYASTLEQLSKHLISRENLEEKYNLDSIISGSELLQENVRENLKKIFHCNVVSRYANEENGILGQDCIEDNHEFHLNVADYYFEFLKMDEDVPAEYGEVARVVVTDLWNYALPMIRYDTGDLAIVGKSRCSLDSLVIHQIFGRKVDLIYNEKREAVSPHMITNNMWGVEGIKQFKFIQHDKNEYEILLNLEKEDCDIEALKNKFKDLLGQGAHITVNYIDEIPVLNSGKRKYIENRMKI